MKGFRYERKFLVPELDAHQMEHHIKHNPKVFSEVFFKRRINNIYFDSFNLKNYFDNLSGHAQRLKVRIRWYGKTFGLIKNPILEIKIKNNYLGKKLRFKLKEFVLDKNFSWEFLREKILRRSGLPKYIVEMLRLSKLVLLNSYKRKYFSSLNKKYRVTLDTNLVFYKMHDKNNSFQDKIHENTMTILELKYSPDFDDNISEITQHFPFRLTSGSKYIYGIDILTL